MTDIFSKEKRSEIMSKIRGKDTKIERKLQPVLAGIMEYHPKGILGNPEFSDLEGKIALFTDGCFWHGCPRHYKAPKSRSWYWSSKIKYNVKRDLETTRELVQAGWKVIRIWEHTVNRLSENDLFDLVRKLYGMLDCWEVIQV